jgi:hypothetical protein
LKRLHCDIRDASRSVFTAKKFATQAPQKTRIIIYRLSPVIIKFCNDLQTADHHLGRSVQEWNKCSGTSNGVPGIKQPGQVRGNAPTGLHAIFDFHSDRRENPVAALIF